MTDETIRAGARVAIERNGRTRTGVVRTAVNWGSEADPNWYVQFDGDDGRPGYWKQALDGGEIRAL